MPRQISLQNLFQFVTAMAALSMWLKYNFDRGTSPWPGFVALLGVAIATWGATYQCSALLALQTVVIGWLVILTTVQMRLIDLLINVPSVDNYGLFLKEVFCAKNDLIILSAIFVIGLLPRFVVLLIHNSRRDRRMVIYLMICVSLSGIANWCVVTLVTLNVGDLDAYLVRILGH